MCRVSGGKSADNCMGGPLYVLCYFSLVAFNIFSLPLMFVNLISICLSVDLSYLGLCISWNWVIVSCPMLWKFSAIISPNIFSGPFSLSSPSGTLKMEMLVHIMLFQRSLGHPFIFSLFFFILFCGNDSVFLVTHQTFCLNY